MKSIDDPASHLRRIDKRPYPAYRDVRGAYAFEGGSHVGSGKGGLLSMPLPDQEILKRSSVIIGASFVEARCSCGLPARALVLLRGIFEENRAGTVVAGIAEVCRRVEEGGLDVLDDRPVADYVAFRAQELAAALNRFRGLRVRVG